MARPQPALQALQRLMPARDRARDEVLKIVVEVVEALPAVGEDTHGRSTNAGRELLEQRGAGAPVGDDELGRL